MIPIHKAMAKALDSAGSQVVTCVPGFGGTQVFDAWAALQNTDSAFSFHEEVAFGAAHGAAIAGFRSAMLTKVHGLAKAANAITDSLYMSFGGAMVVLVFEDKHGSHSDNILEGKPLLVGIQIPYFIPEKDQIISTIYEAFEKSSTLKIPVAVFLDADVVHEETDFEAYEGDFSPVPFERDVRRNLVVPVFARYQFDVMQAKLNGDDFDSIEKPEIPVLPDGLPPDYADYVKPYIPLMEEFKKLRGSMVFGDTGISTLFAFPPYECVDACSYMGGSVAMAVGAAMAGIENCWAVTGDFSFIAAGHLGLIEAAAKKIPVKILIFNNNKAQTTGGQQFDRKALNRILAGYREFVMEIPDPSNHQNVRAVLEKASSSEELQIVVAHYSKHIERNKSFQ